MGPFHSVANTIVWGWSAGSTRLFLVCPRSASVPQVRLLPWAVNFPQSPLLWRKLGRLPSDPHRCCFDMDASTWMLRGGLEPLRTGALSLRFLLDFEKFSDLYGL